MLDNDNPWARGILSDMVQKEEEYMSFIKGKRVALVGPAASLLGQDLGKKIDSYDVVIRIKSFDQEDAESSGTRCDVLYQTSPYDRCDVVEKKEKKIFGNLPSYIFESYVDPIDVYKSRGIQWLCSCYPAQEWFSENFAGDWRSLEDKIQWRFCNYALYKEVRKGRNVGRPNSGFSTFLDLSTLDYSELFICGIDFYRSMYKPNYQNSLCTEDLVHRWSLVETNHGADGRYETHKPDAQYANFKKMVGVLREAGKNITFDPWFESIMNDPSYDAIYDHNPVRQRQVAARWESDPGMGVTIIERNSDGTLPKTVNGKVITPELHTAMNWHKMDSMVGFDLDDTAVATKEPAWDNQIITGENRSFFKGKK